jgi:hypothetical protein
MHVPVERPPQAGTVEALAALAVGLLWIGLGVAKAVAPGEFVSYATLIIGPAAARVATWTVVGAELVLGVAFLGRARQRRGTALVAVASIALALVAALTALADTVWHKPACGCFGSLASATAGRRLVVAGALTFLTTCTLGSRESMVPR